ncbi:MAG TPA: hypothetical protein VGF28_25600 [Thermoanaerobaculia bacterium]|jgi:hypothetical protein
MTSRLATAALALLLTASAYAGEIQTVLAPDSTLYTIDGGSGHAGLELSHRAGDVAEALLVPGTDDEANESDARLLWDSATDTLYVLWHSASPDRDAIMLAGLSGGVWSEPMAIADGASVSRLGLQAALTRAAVDGEEGTGQATLIHAAWWSMGAQPAAEYALIAFEDGQHVSTSVNALEELAGRRSTQSVEAEEVGAPLHPPLAMARAENSVDVVFGSERNTRITRVRLDPRRVQGDARIWKPSGRTGADTGPARLVAADSAPVQAFISKGRIVLYDPGAKFRYVVLENGVWSPLRMIQLDEKVTSDKLLRELHRTVSEQAAADDAAEQQK